MMMPPDELDLVLELTNKNLKSSRKNELSLQEMLRWFGVIILKKNWPITLILLFALLIDLPDLCIYPKTVIVLHPLLKSTHEIK